MGVGSTAGRTKAFRLMVLRLRARLPVSGHRQCDQVGHGLAPQGVEHRSAGSETVRHVVRLAVPLQGRASFAAADVHLNSRVLEAFELRNKTAGALLEARVFEHAK